MDNLNAYEIGKRLGAVFAWICKIERLCYNQKELAEKLGYNACYLSSIRTGHFEVTDAFLRGLKEFEPRLNIDWIRTGEGDMLIATEGIASSDAEHVLGENFEAIEDQKKYCAPCVGKVDFWIKITNASMMPRFYTGDILACRRVDLSSDLRGLVLAVTNERIFVARLSSVYDGLAIFTFDNHERYPRTTAETSSIKEIFQIVGLIRTEL